MSHSNLIDYADCGLTVQQAMVDHAKRFRRKTERPDYILWGGLRIKTSDLVSVPRSGTVRGEFISAKGSVEQGFDVRLSNGWLRLEGGEQVSLLRTWKDKQYEDSVEYPFVSEDGQLWVWNVYKMRYPGGQLVEEKWTENAGFWVELLSPEERIYHCSHGMATPPDFESLVFKVTVLPNE